MLINIQLLRFIAAVMVVFYHSSAHLRASGHEPGLLFKFAHTTGFAGVDVFFVISGFIMVWTTEKEWGGASAIKFAKRRVARIYSGYWPFYLLALGMYYVMGVGYLAEAHFLSSAALWPTELRHLVLPVSWTLIFEMGFYLLFALLIAIGEKRRIAWICGVFVASLAWFLYAQFVRQAYEPGQLEQMSVYEQYLLFPYLLEFLAGAILAYVLARRTQGWSWQFILIGATVFVFSGWLNDSAFGGRLIEGYFVMWRVLLFGSAAVLLLAGMVRLEFRDLQAPARFSVLAGGASYALYLAHTLILGGTRRLGFDAWASQLSPWVAQMAYIGLAALIVAYSIAHYQWLERPLHRLFRRWLRV